MRSPETFDAFYASTRDRLLHETYALTGDLAASRTAVRDSFAAAWHHWRKVATLDDPEEWVRSVAHRRARRRHSARLWHRDKSLDPDVRATLAALSKLTSTQRQLLVLTALSPLSMAAIAREVGLPRPESERQLQTATSQFAVQRDVPSTSLRTLLEELRGPIADARWPRATIIRRAGTARRRTHTAAGAMIAAGALVVSGSVVGTAADAQVTGLSQERMTPTISVREVSAEPPPPPVLAEDSLLDDDQVRRYGPSLEWEETATHDNLGGNGLVLPCQPERFADPAGMGALVRTWDGSAETVQKKRVRRGGKVRVRKTRVATIRAQATQFVELSADPATAEAAFAKARAWYAGCQDPRTQLTSTRRVAGVGEDATLFRLRAWRHRPASLTVGVARTGQVVVTTVVRALKGTVGDKAATSGLAAAVNGLCGSPGAGSCADLPRSRPIAPLPIAHAPLLGSVDLPPVTRARGPWVGTDPDPGKNTNYAASTCDKTSFAGKQIDRAVTRTFVFPETRGGAGLALTQTLGRMSQGNARAFVETVRARMRKCEDGTSVTTLAATRGRRQELAAWALMVELGPDRAVPFFMAIVRQGGVVSQVGFNPVGARTMTRADFVGVAHRALQRLGTSPRKG